MSELRDSYRRRPNFRWRFNTVTSLVDFYGFRNMGEWSVEDLDDNLVHEFDKKNLCRERVFPYIQRHEFEGLLFSNTSAFQVIADVDERDVTALTEIRGNFTSPEDINDGYETARASALCVEFGDTIKLSMASLLLKKQAWRRSARNAHGLRRG